MMATCAVSRFINHNYRLGQLGLNQAVKFQKESPLIIYPKELHTHVWFASWNPRTCWNVTHMPTKLRASAHVWREYLNSWIEIMSNSSSFSSSSSYSSSTAYSPLLLLLLLLILLLILPLLFFHLASHSYTRISHGSSLLSHHQFFPHFQFHPRKQNSTIIWKSDPKTVLFRQATSLAFNSPFNTLYNKI